MRHTPGEGRRANTMIKITKMTIRVNDDYLLTRSVTSFLLVLPVYIRVFMEVQFDKLFSHQHFYPSTIVTYQ